MQKGRSPGTALSTLAVYHVAFCFLFILTFISLSIFFIIQICGVAILTKPDLIDRGAEIDVLNIVQGKIIPLSKGYIIVRCRGQSDINNNIPFDKAIEAELNFFRNHHYFRYLIT